MIEPKVSIIRAVEKARARRRPRSLIRVARAIDPDLLARCELAAGERILASLPDDHVEAVVLALSTGGSVVRLNSREQSAWSQYPEILRECISAGARELSLPLDAVVVDRRTIRPNRF